MSAVAVRAVGEGGGGSGRPRAIFLTDFIHLSFEYETVAPVLLDPHAAWLDYLELSTGTGLHRARQRGGEAVQPADNDADDEADDEADDAADAADDAADAAGKADAAAAEAVLDPRSRIVMIGPGAKLARQPVKVTAGEPREHPDAIFVPISWVPTAFDRILPALEADLELTRFDGANSRLGVSGRYYVPLARLGSRLDAAGLHRVAEATLRRFLRGVEQAILAGRLDV